MGNSTSGDVGSLRGIKAIRRLSKKNAVAKWKNRQLPEQIFGVVRHAERADGTFAFYRGGRWTQTEDFQRFPLDPPLSDSGLEGAMEIGSAISEYADECNTRIHVVISSPYARCVQTAAAICEQLGPSVRLIIDFSIGEVFGPAVMGDEEPVATVRSIDTAVEYCKAKGVKVNRRSIGKWPYWPEDLKTARKRYANRFLTYLQRSQTARRNFLLVTHADCVGAALQMMPSQAGYAVSSVEFGGFFLGRRPGRGQMEAEAHDSSPNSLPTFGGVLPSMPESPEPEAEADAEVEAFDDSPTYWTAKAAKGQIVSAWAPAEQRMKARTSRSLGPLPRLLRSPSGASMASTAATSSTSSPSGGTIEDVSPPKASDGWKVKVNNIHLRQRVDDSAKPKTNALTKRLQALAKHSQFTKERIEQLLGALSEEPLGSKRQTLAAQPDEGQRVQTICSMSTYLFGASDVDSEWGSRRLTDTSVDLVEIAKEARASLRPADGNYDELSPTTLWRSRREFNNTDDLNCPDGVSPRSTCSAKSKFCIADRHKSRMKSAGAALHKEPLLPGLNSEERVLSRLKKEVKVESPGTHQRSMTIAPAERCSEDKPQGAPARPRCRRSNTDHRFLFDSDIGDTRSPGISPRVPTTPEETTVPADNGAPAHSVPSGSCLKNSDGANSGQATPRAPTLKTRSYSVSLNHDTPMSKQRSLSDCQVPKQKVGTDAPTTKQVSVSDHPPVTKQVSLNDSPETVPYDEEPVTTHEEPVTKQVSLKKPPISSLLARRSGRPSADLTPISLAPATKTGTDAGPSSVTLLQPKVAESTTVAVSPQVIEIKKTVSPRSPNDDKVSPQVIEIKKKNSPRSPNEDKVSPQVFEIKKKNSPRSPIEDKASGQVIEVKKVVAPKEDKAAVAIKPIDGSNSLLLKRRMKLEQQQAAQAAQSETAALVDAAQ